MIFLWLLLASLLALIPILWLAAWIGPWGLVLIAWLVGFALLRRAAARDEGGH